MNKNFFLIGYSEELVTLSEKAGLKLSGIIDLKKKPPYKSLNFYTATQKELESLKIDGVVIGVDDPMKRKHLYDYYKNKKIKILSLYTKKLEPSCSFKDGLIIQDSAIISCNCNFGKNVKINMGATVMHDSIIGDFVTIAPSAVILGRVKINSYSYIGANSTILPDTVIGKNVIIGAGAVVTKNVPSNTVARGVPAQFFKKID